MTRSEIAAALLETRPLGPDRLSPQVVVETAAGHLLSITRIEQRDNGLITLRVTWGDEPR